MQAISVHTASQQIVLAAIRRASTSIDRVNQVVHGCTRFVSHLVHAIVEHVLRALQGSHRVALVSLLIDKAVYVAQLGAIVPDSVSATILGCHTFSMLVLACIVVFTAHAGHCIVAVCVSHLYIHSSLPIAFS